MTKRVCKICVLQKGLTLEIAQKEGFNTDNELMEHLHDRHGFAITDKKHEGYCIVCGEPINKTDKIQEAN